MALATPAGEYCSILFNHSIFSISVMKVLSAFIYVSSISPGYTSLLLVETRCGSLANNNLL